VKVLVVGSGAREHALAWRLSLDGADVTVAPGNAGTVNNVPIEATDIEGLAGYAAARRIDLTVVGPETPLAAGIVDEFSARGLAIFGPTRVSARLEWSKAWTKQFMQRHGIPTARAEIAATEAEARGAIARTGLPVAIKADGLAAGKGVWLAHTWAEVDEALRAARALGKTAETLVIEECLSGPEVSVLAFTDGERLAVMPPARDYKRIFDGDRGPNTGGMGGYTWPSDATPDLLRDVEELVLRPTLHGMAAEGTPYRGVLYAGLMLTPSGPRALEFNSRFGDPECQLILPLVASGFLDACQSIAAGKLEPPRWRSGQTFGVVLAAAGYPAAPRAGDAVSGLEALPPSVHAFHAGTAFRVAELVTAGGRVLTLVGESRKTVYAAAELVRFAGKQYRRDIGLEMAVAAR
jgi:phosphoribosylamine---glycine ligase